MVTELTVATAENEAKTALTWLQKHESLIFKVLVIVALVWGFNKFIDYQATRAERAEAVAAQQLTEQKQKDQEIAAQVSSLTAQYQVMVTQLTAANAQLQHSMAQRSTSLAQQQAVDNKLAPSDLSKRWAELIGIDPEQFDVTGSGTNVSDTAAHITVQQLERVPVLEQNFKDETAIAENNAQELDKANGVIGGLNNQVDSLKVTNADEQKACDAKVAQVKADDRKSKRNWFVRGLEIGGAAVVVLSHFI